jgi:DNA replication protein DnaC
VEDWGKLLGDNASTSAILDRFLDQAEIIPMEGKSYRTARRKGAPDSKG